MWRPDTPIHAEYPPGYPLFLAITGLVAHDSIDWFLALNIAAVAATIWLVVRVVATRWSWWVALGVAFLLALNPYLVDSGGQLASEPLFMFCGVAAVTLLADRNPGGGRLAGAGALAIYAAMTRSVGVALVMAIGLHWLLERRWKAVAIFAAASLATVGAWLAWTVHAASGIMGESYVGDAVASMTGGRSSFAATMVGRVAAHLADFSASVLPLVLATPSIPATLVDNVIGAAVAGLAVAAGLWVYWSRWRAAALYVVISIAVLLAWPFMLTRFAIPLIPLLAAAFVAGAVTLLRPGRAGWRLAALAAIIVTLGVTGTVRSGRLIARRAGCVHGSPPEGRCVTPDKGSVYAAARYVRDHLPADAVVVYAKPETLSWYSGRRTLPVRLALAGDSTVVSEARAAGANYLLLSSVQAIETTALQDRLRVVCGALSVEASFPPRTWLFRLAPAAEGSSACGALLEYQRLNRGRNFEADPR